MWSCLTEVLIVLLMYFRRFQNFFFSHIMLIESYVHKLKLAVDEALAARSRAIICKVLKCSRSLESKKLGLLVIKEISSLFDKH